MVQENYRLLQLAEEVEGQITKIQTQMSIDVELVQVESNLTVQRIQDETKLETERIRKQSEADSKVNITNAKAEVDVIHANGALEATKNIAAGEKGWFLGLGWFSISYVIFY